MGEPKVETRKSKAACSCPYCGCEVGIDSEYRYIKMPLRNLWMCVGCSNRIADAIKEAGGAE